MARIAEHADQFHECHRIDSLRAVMVPAASTCMTTRLKHVWGPRSPEVVTTARCEASKSWLVAIAR